MTAKPEGDEIIVGPNTKVKIYGVALISVLSGLCVAAAAVAVGVERLNRNIEERPTRTEIFYWSLDAQRAVPGLPVFPPGRKKE